MNRFAFLLCLSLAWGNVSQANKITDFYEIESVSPPELLLRRYGNSKGGQGTQADGLDFMPYGRLVACLVGGEVFTLHPKTGKWKLFADGLHTPLGVVALNDREVMVSQRPELIKVFYEQHPICASLRQRGLVRFIPSAFRRAVTRVTPLRATDPLLGRPASF